MTLRLTGDQKRGLSRALMSALPSQADLEQMLLFELDTHLAQVAPTNAPLPNIVLRVIQWAEAHGRTEELILGARTYVPGNPDLRAFAADLGLAAE